MFISPIIITSSYLSNDELKEEDRILAGIPHKHRILAVEGLVNFDQEELEIFDVDLYFFASLKKFFKGSIVVFMLNP